MCAPMGCTGILDTHQQCESPGRPCVHLRIIPAFQTLRKRMWESRTPMCAFMGCAGILDTHEQCGNPECPRCTHAHPRLPHQLMGILGIYLWVGSGGLDTMMWESRMPMCVFISGANIAATHGSPKHPWVHLWVAQVFQAPICASMNGANMADTYGSPEHPYGHLWVVQVFQALMNDVGVQDTHMCASRSGANILDTLGSLEHPSVHLWVVQVFQALISNVGVRDTHVCI